MDSPVWLVRIQILTSLPNYENLDQNGGAYHGTLLESQHHSSWPRRCGSSPSATETLVRCGHWKMFWKTHRGGPHPGSSAVGAGWVRTPLKNMTVNWEYYSQYMGTQTTNQDYVSWIQMFLFFRSIETSGKGAWYEPASSGKKGLKHWG